MLGIIGAMDVEVEALKKRIESPAKATFGKSEFVCGEIEGVMVCVAQCGPGKVNAAMCTQLMIDKFQPERIINLGVGCSLAPDVAIKNIVIATDVCQYDIDSTGCGDPPGFISGLNVIKIETDKALSDALALAAIRTGERIHRGTVATGDTFIASQALREKIASQFGALCGEMEGGAIGQVCFACGVPFAVLRTVSDGGNEASAMDYPAFKLIAARASTAVITEYIRSQKTQLELDTP